MVSAFEGNKAETKTMLPVIETFMAACQLPDVTVVADAGMISEASAAGSSTRPAGPSESSSRPPAATAPSRSRPASTPSLPSTHSPTTSA